MNPRILIISPLCFLNSIKEEFSKVKTFEVEPFPIEKLESFLTDFAAPAYYNLDKEPLCPCYIEPRKRKMQKMRKKRLRY